MRLTKAAGEVRVSTAVAALRPFALAEIMRGAAQRKAIDLALGIPEIDAPEAVKEAAVRAILDGDNQYINAWGARELREAIAAHAGKKRGLAFDPEDEVTVTVGTTEAMYVTLAALLDPGDEVVLFEPFYEQHLHTVLTLGGVPRLVPLRPPAWQLDEAALAAAISPRTKAIVLNTPHNPTGKVFTAAELSRIGDLTSSAAIVSDEIYDDFVFDGRAHVSPIQLEGLRERTVAIAGLSKIYRVSGWRLGYALAAPRLSRHLRRVHDLVSAGTATPLQRAALAAFRLPPEERTNLSQLYERQRDRTACLLGRIGMTCLPSEGSIYFMADVSALELGTDVEVVDYFLREAGVVFAPGSCFFGEAARGKHLLRVCFAKTDATLAAAEARLPKPPASQCRTRP